MSPVQTALVADEARPLTQGRSAQEVEAAIAAWLSVAGDRHSRLRRALRDVNEPEAIMEYFAHEDIEIDHELLDRLLTGLTRLPA
jgi:hypothetical protein